MSSSSSSSSQSSSASSLSFDDVDVKVLSVEVEGQQHTDEAFIKQEFEKAYQAHKLGDVADKLLSSLQSLRALDIFKSAECVLEVADDASAAADTKVKVRVVEKKRPHARSEMSVDLKSGVTTATLTGSMRNAFGRAEQVSVSTANGSNGDRSFSLRLLKPRIGGSRNKASLSAFRFRQDALFSSYVLTSRGASLDVSDDANVHTFGYSAAWRDVAPKLNAADGVADDGSVVVVDKDNKASKIVATSSEVLDMCVPSTKTAVHYTYVRDRLDSTYLPRQGTFAKVRAELASGMLGGDVDFIKLEGAVKLYWPLTNTSSFGLSFMSGVMRPLHLTAAPAAATANSATTTHVQDRFFLGGPLNIRGFSASTVSTHDERGAALGGDVMAAAAACYSFLLPGKFADLGVYGQLFANVGNATQLQTDVPLADQARAFLADARVSAGVGIVVPTSFGRLEFNICQPLKHLPNDTLSRFQLGLGVDFL